MSHQLLHFPLSPLPMHDSPRARLVLFPNCPQPELECSRHELSQLHILGKDQGPVSLAKFFSLLISLGEEGVRVFWTWELCLGILGSVWTLILTVDRINNMLHNNGLLFFKYV